MDSTSPERNMYVVAFVVKGQNVEREIKTFRFNCENDKLWDSVEPNTIKGPIVVKNYEDCICYFSKHTELLDAFMVGVNITDLFLLKVSSRREEYLHKGLGTDDDVDGNIVRLD